MMTDSPLFYKIKVLTNTEAQALKSELQTQQPSSGCTDSLDRCLHDIFASVVHDIHERYRAIIIQFNSEDRPPFSFDQIQTLNPRIAQMFGELLVQNEQGDTVITVYDRDRLGSMNLGARYHQTREGGSIHTDNVNIPVPWDYLYLSCLSPAPVGGENILVDGFKIHDLLKSDFPNAFETLQKDFIWEMRGVADKLYHAPILTYNEQSEPVFRHLRPYMESAHQKANTPLTAEQLYAVDVLDALTNSSENQLRYRMNAGDVLLSKDAQVLHGRTCFSDAFNAIPLNALKADEKKLPVTPVKRTMERIWIKKR